MEHAFAKSIKRFLLLQAALLESQVQSITDRPYLFQCLHPASFRGRTARKVPHPGVPFSFLMSSLGQ